MFSALDISSSGLAAQRMRMNARSSNIANMSTTHNERGERVPYQPKYVVFEADDTVGSHGAPGVRVAAVKTADVEPRWVYDPHHPEAERLRSGVHGNNEFMEIDSLLLRTRWAVAIAWETLGR